MRKCLIYVIMFVLSLSFSSICYAAPSIQLNNVIETQIKEGNGYINLTPIATSSMYEVKISYRRTHAGTAGRLYLYFCRDAYWFDRVTENHYGTSTQEVSDNQWHSETFYIPNNGYKSIGFSSVKNIYWDIKVDYVKYYDYSNSFDISLSVDENKRVVLNVSAKEPMPQFSAGLYNNTTKTGTGNVRNHMSNHSSNGTVKIIDTSVIAEKLYDYTIYYGFYMYNSYNDYGYNTISIPKSIFVPSDSTLAKQAAERAESKSQTAVDQTWYTGTYGGSSENVANIAGYIRNTQLPNLETKMNNLQLAVTNIQNSDTLPPIVDVQTVSGARATSGSSIPAIVTVTDNRPGPFTYSINGGGYSALPSDGRITLPVSSPGNNSITISVKDVAGNIGSKTIVIRKL